MGAKWVARRDIGGSGKGLGWHYPPPPYTPSFFLRPDISLTEKAWPISKTKKDKIIWHPAIHEKNELTPKENYFTLNLGDDKKVMSPDTVPAMTYNNWLELENRFKAASAKEWPGGDYGGLNMFSDVE